MSSGGLATTHQCTMATLCDTLHKHEVGPDGHGWGGRDSPRSTAWTERVRDARIALITRSSVLKRTLFLGVECLRAGTHGGQGASCRPYGRGGVTEPQRFGARGA